MTIAVPVEIPVTTPDVLTVAILLLLVVQVPLTVASESVVIAPAHTDAVPVITAGCILTV